MNLTDEQKKAIMDQIHNFFLEEYDEDLGIIKQQRIFDLFAEELAPIVYNKALDDAMLWYKRQQENLEADFYSLYKEMR
ncbi:MAG: DUF2164 family protein [Lachnospiraceae bacterium]|nr:DUF2164 family protein [Lachnospiraceae bacterium]